jgi:arginine repressor
MPSEQGAKQVAIINAQGIDTFKELRRKRLKAILEFARKEVYTGQVALTEWLAERGLGCNQGQLSKDLDTLGLTPYIDRYGEKHLGRRSKILHDQVEERYVKIFQEAVREVYLHGDSVMIDTVPGGGQIVATIVESACWREVVAIYYGMSSVTITCFSDVMAEDIMDRVKEGIL